MIMLTAPTYKNGFLLASFLGLPSKGKERPWDYRMRMSKNYGYYSRLSVTLVSILSV